MNRIIIIFTALLSLMLFPTCKKYADGPSFSLLTKKMRITGDWKLEQFIYNEKDITTYMRDSAFGEDYVWSIRKDGTYRETGKIDKAGISKLIENKERVHFSSTDTSGVYSYRILRLTNKQLWFEHFNMITLRTEITKLKQ